MKKTLLVVPAALAVLGATLAILPTASQAEEAANPLSFNLSLTSDYRYRGISQSRLKPALQGGADYAFANGFYLGTWASTIKWIKDAGTIAKTDAGSADIELDLYGGYKGEIVKDLGYDVGVLQYVYPGNKYDKLSGKKADTTEIYGAVTYGPATLKYSHSLSSLFGTADATHDSKNSGYVDLSAGFDVGSGVTVTPHIGYQRVAHFGDYSYTDYAVTVSKDWQGFSWSGAVIGADVKKIGGVPAYVSPAGKDLGKAALVLAVKKTF